jgi:outer membrane protein assembly factor BamB
VLAVAPSRNCRGALRWLLPSALAGLAAAGWFAAAGRQAPAAQPVLSLDVASPQQPSAAFTLPAQPTDYKDALADFQRMVKHEQWEKAFAALDAISKKTTTGFVDRGDGVFVPSRLLVRGLLAELPSAGRSAYRLFHDKLATQLWEQAQGSSELANLSAIVNNHPISSIGDRAADRLGDLYFERGDFEQAIAAWQSLLTYSPDSKLSKAQTQLKIATALARAGRWNEFRAIESLVGEQFAGEEVEMGGRRVSPAEHLALLAASADSGAAVVDAAPAADIPLPVDGEPAWRFTISDGAPPRADNNNNNNANPFMMVDAYGRTMSNDYVIPAAVDDARVYVNVFGVVMAFDLETGKLLWRSGKLHQLDFQQARQGIAPERYAIHLHGDRVWSVSRDPQQAGQQGAFVLVAREAASGKELFNSQRALAAWSILGEPRVIGDVLYVGAQRNRQGRELSLLAVDIPNGKLQKSLPIGSYAADANQMYMAAVARPTFAWRGDRLYLDTNSGALVAVKPQADGVDWAILYDSPVPQGGYNYDALRAASTLGDPLFAAGLMFTKGLRSSRLVAVACDGPKLVWNRPVANSSILVGADDAQVYLGGEELTAYNLKTQELAWATKLPRAVDWSLPRVTANRIYQFTSRGVCEVDKKTGEIVTIFRGADLESLGGSLFVAGGKLITVSNLNITAYPLAPAAAQAQAP